MISSDPNNLLEQLTTILDECNPVDWDDIVSLLDQIKNKKKASIIPKNEEMLEFFARGTAFITFSYGIDGVTVETSKYAHTLKDLFTPMRKSSIHLIGESFQPQVSSILPAEWHRHKIDGINGWNKWDDGKWFKALFRKRMSSASDESDQLLAEVYRQAVVIAKCLGKYFLDNQIALVVPVNIASNPGNMALTLGLVLVTEILGIYVLNSNHDFYWEAGKPFSEREPGEEPGVRDHFFRNINNQTFFTLFKLIYPWNGSRWLQININARQSRRLVNHFGFPEEKISEISTYIADTFFETYSKKDVIDIRLRMGHILSDGNPIMHPIAIGDLLSNVDNWMQNQEPIILGARSGLSVDPRSDDLIILLQPTRIVSRKRIERNLELIGALFQGSELRAEFEKNPNRQLILQITGPAPKEHQDDLETVLFAYQKAIKTFPEMLSDRVFIAFSVGKGTHASFPKNEFKPLRIVDLYRMADVVVFPSETEGRGLPIIESSASGIPIICSHYRPREVFSDVIGEELPDDLRIRYTLFPEGKFSKPFLSEAANLLIHPRSEPNNILHNIEAVQARFSHAAFKKKFERLLNQFSKME